MDRRSLLVAGVACAAAGLVAALTLPAAAGSRPSGSLASGALAADGVPAAMLAAMQRDLGLSAEGARTRLAAQDAAGRVDLTLRKSVGTAYAGAWMSADTLVVAVTNPAQAATVRAAGAAPRIVARGAAQLDAVKARLDGNAGRAPRSVPGWYVDVTTNSVVVLSRPDGLAAARAFVAAAGASDARIEVSTEDPRPFIDVIGGNAYFIGAGTRCSVGFSVNGGFVTAGHCGTTGATTTQPSGTFRGSSFPGNDYAWVQVAAGNAPRGLVNGYGNPNVTVAGSQAAAVGSTVCRSGSTTGWHCGTIQALNSSVTYPQGTVTGLIRTNVCAEPGDSGGSLVAGSQAQGVTSGGSGNCSSGGTTFFQPVNEILSTYGLQLVTGGGTPPTTPPGGGGCTGFEARYPGTLSSGGQQVQPNGSYFFAAAGTHQACLDGPTGTDFDIYLQRWNGAGWVRVAAGDSPNADETLSFNGSSGYYRYIVHAYSGSGGYALGINTP